MKEFYTMKAAGKTGEILIYDQIGEDFWTGEGTTAKKFAADLKALGAVDTLNVRINSPGGQHVEALGIYNTLTRHAARIEVDVDGIAASAAATIAMAGDEIRIAENAMLMIHNPFMHAAGDAAELRKAANLLDSIKATLVSTYAARSKAAPEAIAAWMDEEKWMDGPEAKALGFADVVTAAKRVENRFDLTRYVHGAQAARRLAVSNQARLLQRLEHSRARFITA